MAKNLNLAASVTTVSGMHVSRETKELAKEKIKELIAEETKLVRGTFINFETPGAAAPITVRKYPGVPTFRMTLKDGEMYEIPLYVARFLNGIDVSVGAVDNPNKGSQFIGTCRYAVHGWKMDHADDFKRGMETGDTVVPISGVTSHKKRYGFNSAEFSGFA